jgi:hypothetical protein
MRLEGLGRVALKQRSCRLLLPRERERDLLLLSALVLFPLFTPPSSSLVAICIWVALTLLLVNSFKNRAFLFIFVIFPLIFSCRKNRYPMATREDASPLRSFLAQLRVAPHHASALEVRHLTLPLLASLGDAGWADLPLPKGPLVRVKAALKRGLWEHCVAEQTAGSGVGTLAYSSRGGNGGSGSSGAASGGSGGLAAWNGATTR